jgi:hypothetical protein
VDFFIVPKSLFIIYWSNDFKKKLIGFLNFFWHNLAFISIQLHVFFNEEKIKLKDRTKVSNISKISSFFQLCMKNTFESPIF